jgi:uncharacterized protein (UPF0332 family)
MLNPDSLFFEKALESLAGAESEFANDRFNNAANRCYYAMFQAAIVALTRAGVTPRGREGQWSHAFVPAAFDGELINRRTLYPASLRGSLNRTYKLREKADYQQAVVSRTEAARAVRRAQEFVAAVRGGERR